MQMLLSKVLATAIISSYIATMSIARAGAIHSTGGSLGVDGDITFANNSAVEFGGMERCDTADETTVHSYNALLMFKLRM